MGSGETKKKARRLRGPPFNTHLTQRRRFVAEWWALPKTVTGATIPTDEGPSFTCKHNLPEQQFKLRVQGFELSGRSPE